MLALKENLLDRVMKEFTLGVFISLTICGLVSTEICSVYNNIPTSKYQNDLNSISYKKSYDLNQIDELSMNIEIKFECDTLIFNAEEISLGEITLKNSNNTKIYTTWEYSTYKTGILKISFAKIIPPGNYNLHFYYNYKGNLPGVLSEWLVLTNFDENNIDKKNNENIRIWIRKSALSHGKYLMDNAKNLLVAFKNFTGTTYNENKYVKLDLFVLPKSLMSKDECGDFICVDEETFINEEFIATKNNEKLFHTVAELVVDQAFQNYNFSGVCRYNQLISKFKKYLVYYITDKATKTQHSIGRYVFKQRYKIFDEDFVFNRRRNIDLLYYSNGYFLVRMIAHIVGENNIDKIIQYNLQNRDKIKNTNFFFDLLEMTGNKKIFLTRVINKGMGKSGYPIVKVQRNYSANIAVVKQALFTKKTDKNLKSKFWVPLNFASEDDADFDNTTVTDWLDPAIETIEISAPSQDKWLMCNKQQFGYYRVNYDERNWKLIINYLKSKNYYKIHVLNRAQLIDDAFVLAEFGYLNFNIAFDLSRYLNVETEYVPWATFWEKMFRLFQYSSISSSRYWEPFKNMILELSGPLERKLLSDEASDGNDRMERLTKISFIKWTCFYGSTLCRKYSLSKLENWLADPIQNPLLEDIRGEILCAGIRSADEETWNKLLDKFLITKDEDILYALMCSSNYELLDKLMMRFISGQLIEMNVWYFLIHIAQKSTIGLDAIINFIDNREEAIHAMYNNYNLNAPSGFFNDNGEPTFEKKNFRDIIESFSSVIEQFSTNHQQLNKLKKILNDNLDFLKSEDAEKNLYYAQFKVGNATSVFDSMESYWKGEN